MNLSQRMGQDFSSMSAETRVRNFQTRESELVTVNKDAIANSFFTIFKNYCPRANLLWISIAGRSLDNVGFVSFSFTSAVIA